jgi:hypothetical protein
MNRLKLWVFTLLTVGAGAAWLYAASGRMVARSIESIDARLRAAKALAEARTRLLGREASNLAGAAARDPALASARAPVLPPEPPRSRRVARPPPLPPPPPTDLLPLADAALRAAAQAAGMDASQGLVTGLVRESKLVLLSGGREVKVDGDAAAPAPLLEAAEDGRAREALVRVEHVIYYTTALPVIAGTALVVGLPLDAGWAQSIHAATGADVTLVVDEKRTVSTVAPSEAKTLLDTVKKPSSNPVDVGALGSVKLHAIPTPGIPLLFAKAPGWRAQAVSLPGVSETVVLSRSTRSQLAPIAMGQQVALLGLAVLFLLGLVLGFLVRSEPPPVIPRDLLMAADRIAHGEFDVRAPALAGQLGTVAEALNRAAEAAARKPEPQPAEEAALPLPVAAPSFEPVAARDFFAEPARSAEAFALPAISPAASELPAFPAAEQRSPEPVSGPSAEPPAASSPALLEPSRPAPELAASPADAEEEHWQRVFEEFLLIRRQCGEPSDGLTFEKFRQKLQKNRDGLIEKYGCKAVRFQAYVKDGKAAIKATPVR